MMFAWFRRSSAKPRLKLPPQPRAERDWELGDVAKCVVAASGTWIGLSGEVCAGPKTGQLHRVVGVFAADDTVYLRFAAWPANGYAAGNFKKLRACSTDFREQLRRPAKLPKVRALPERVR